MYNLPKTFISNYKGIFIVYCILFAGLTAPYIFYGDVIAPHLQLSELATFNEAPNNNLSTRKFSDFSRVFIPEISTHLNSTRSGWLTLWTNNNELGRPAYHISGFSPAYFPSWVISIITKSPWKFITILSLLTSFIAGIFVILLCREIELHPLAGLIAGISLSTSTLFMYWLTFPMFTAVLSWSAGIIWAATRLAKKPDLIGWSVLAFSSYSLLMTGYPQMIVLHAYILVAYGVYLSYIKYHRKKSELGQFLILTLSALSVGIILALPIYFDLYDAYVASARVNPNPSFFTEILPKLNSFSEAIRFFVLGTTPELLGNPVKINYPFPFNGISVTPVIIFFTIIGLFTSFKKIWGWFLAIIILYILTFVQPIYLFAVKYLGLNLSRNLPLASSLIPLTIIVAYGANTLLKREKLGEHSTIISIATATTLTVIIIGISFAIYDSHRIQIGAIITMFILVGLFYTQHQQTLPLLLIAALITTLISISSPLMLHQDPTRIATTSPLVKSIQENLPLDSRFALTEPTPYVLPPNLNSGLNIASIHSYNSLSPKSYHYLIKTLGGEMQTYGRFNDVIAPNYNSTMFWMSNISLLLSAKKLQHENIEYIGRKSGVRLHKVISRMGDSIQVIHDKVTQKIITTDILNPRLYPGHKPDKLIDQVDFLEFKVKPATTSTLILSQKFNPNWQAQVLIDSDWISAQTVAINKVFQGVVLPKGTNRVRLKFRAYAYYSWIAHVFWIFLIAIIFVNFFYKRNHESIALAKFKLGKSNQHG